MYDIKVELTQHPKAKPQDESKLGFGKIFTDHMFIMDYDQENGWHDARVVPYGPFMMDPASTVFHYAQEIFEGLKCYRRADGGLQLFRPRDNFARMNRSAQRLCMPEIDIEQAMAGLTALLKADAEWVPHQVGTELHGHSQITVGLPQSPVHRAGVRPAMAHCNKDPRRLFDIIPFTIQQCAPSF